jgi:hypothetical protein
MKNFLLAVTLLASFVLGSRNLEAQGYGPYYYGPHWAYLQLHDPYYDLHAMHYQRYLRQYQPYQVYQPCCYAWGVISQPSLPIRPEPQPVIGPRGQAIVGPLPPAVAPLPPAIGPLSPATRSR